MKKKTKKVSKKCNHKFSKKEKDAIKTANDLLFNNLTDDAEINEIIIKKLFLATSATIDYIEGNGASISFLIENYPKE